MSESIYTENQEVVSWDPTMYDDQSTTMDPDHPNGAPISVHSFMTPREEIEEESQAEEEEEDAPVVSSKDNALPPSTLLKYIFVAAGLILGFIMFFITIDGDRKINQTLGIAIWMATLWLTEIIPLVVTSFLPLVLLPLFGILNSKTVATQYINNTIILMYSGFLMAVTLERWNLHKRLSLKILTWCGSSSLSLLLLGMMAPTYLLSMFISNTATSLMMVPNALSICSTLENKKELGLFDDDTSSDGGSENKHDDVEAQKIKQKKMDGKFATALLLGIAYAANVGGMSSLIGTPPNLVFQRQFELFFPDAPPFSFATWIAFGLPTGLVMFVVIWAYLSVAYLRGSKKRASDQKGSEKKIFKDMYAALGGWSREQVLVAVLFLVLCLLWIFRKDLNFGSFTIRGWSNIFPEPSYVSDGTTGMTIVVILFILPARSSKLGTAESSAKGDDEAHWQSVEGEELEAETAPLVQETTNRCDTTLLNWETANTIPYDVIFLLGGGFALAKAFVESGLSMYLGSQLANLNISLAGLVFLMISLIIWLTELTSNTATSNIMVPLAASLAVAGQASPYTFMISATLACSCAFFLPIATPPNTVVFSTGLLPMREMNKAGVFLNIIGSVVVFGAAYTVIPATLGVQPAEFPTWAESHAL